MCVGHNSTHNSWNDLKTGSTGAIHQYLQVASPYGFGVLQYGGWIPRGNILEVCIPREPDECYIAISDPVLTPHSASFAVFNWSNSPSYPDSPSPWKE